MSIPLKRRSPCTGGGWLAVAVVTCALPAVAAENSWNVWLDQAAHKSISEKSALRAGQSLRYACDDGRLSTYYLEAGYVRHARPWLDLGLAYRQQYDHRDTHWVEENRPYGDVTVRWKTTRVTVSDRSRLEYRHREEQDDTWRYRNKVVLQYSAWDKALGLKPYVGAEAFVDESASLRERDQTRCTVGIRTDPERHILRAVQWRLGDAMSMDYYVTQQRTKKSDEWTDEYVAGVQIGVSF